MSLRNFLLIPLLVSLGFFLYFSSAVVDSFSTLVDSITVSVGFIAAIAAAVLLQIAGHIIRAYKARLLLRPIKESSVRFQFRALGIGYLFNAILPLKLGELIRARIVSDAMTISFSYALTLIIFERMVDAFILGIAGLLVLGAFQAVPVATVYHISVMLGVALLVLAVLLMLIKQNRGVLRMIHKTTEALNDNLKDSFRFKAWSVVYGLQQTLKMPLLKRYIALTVASWVLYFGSVLVIVQYFFAGASVMQKVVAVVAPYYGFAVPSGPASLGVFSKITNTFNEGWHASSAQLLQYNLVVWAVLIVPIAFIGLVLLFTKTREALWRTRPKVTSQDSLMNKLYRTEDISLEMSSFLENYFAGNTLSKIVHQLELYDNFRLVKYFKGGSDAITILGIQDGKEIVKKIIPLDLQNRLRAQYRWLRRHRKTPAIVRVLGESKAPNYYAIDLAYNPDDEMFYEYIHQNPVSRSTAVLRNTWRHLFAHVYNDLDPQTLHARERERYIDKHVFHCLELAMAVDSELKLATLPAKIVINGKTYDNLFQIMEKIRNHPQAWRDIGKYRKSAVVHGDVIVDNLLVTRSTNEVTIIDPAPDGNIVNGPVFDFGKNLQSLYCGYESLLRDEDTVFLKAGNQINYRDASSHKYEKLSNYVRDTLAPQYLTESEQRSMLFHAGVLFIRRLKHQVYYTPGNVLKFYAVGVKTLNDFLAQYDDRARR